VQTARRGEERIAMDTEILDGAISHGDEHVIKFTDTAAEVYQRTGNPDALAAALQCARLIGRPG
jgi:hypothetical protein